MPDIIYLDNAATTRCDPRVVAEMTPFFTEHFGNPSSRHSLGLSASEALESSRRRLAKALGVEASWVIFTASGSEANSLAIFGAIEANKGQHIVTTVIEHPAVLETVAAVEQKGVAVSRVAVGEAGVVNPDEVLAAIRPETTLVSIMHVNNEIGTIQPITEIGRRLKALSQKTLFHTDAVQSLASVPLDIEGAGIDLVTLSGHKIHAPKGVGALLCRPKVKLTPRIFGGGQESGRRSGTENVAFARALCVATEIAIKERSSLTQKATLRDALVDGILSLIPEATLNGDRSRWAPLHASLSFPGVKSEVLRNVLESKGVLTSSGAACNTRKGEASHVLRAIGHPSDGVRGTLRFSLSRDTTQEEIERTIVAVHGAFRSLSVRA